MGSVDWIYLAYYVDEWPALVKAMMNIWILKNSVHVWII